MHTYRKRYRSERRHSCCHWGRYRRANESVDQCHNTSTSIASDQLDCPATKQPSCPERPVYSLTTVRSASSHTLDSRYKVQSLLWDTFHAESILEYAPIDLRQNRWKISPLLRTIIIII